MRRTLSAVGVALFAALVVLGVVPGTSLSAAALGEGCPPQATMCNPTALAEMVAVGDDVLLGQIGAAAGAGTSVVGSAVANAAGVVVAGGAATLTTMAIRTYFFDESSGLISEGDPATAGFDGGSNIATKTYSTTARWDGYATVIGPAYGASGHLTVTLTAAPGSTGPCQAPNTAGHMVVTWYSDGVSHSVGYESGGPLSNMCTAGSTITYGANVTGLTRVIVGGKIWRPVGAPDRYEPPEGGLDGQVTVTTHCTLPDSTIQDWVNVIAASGGNSIEVPASACPAGVLTGQDVNYLPGGGSGGGSGVKIGGYEAPEWVQDMPTEYPECMGSVCEVTLWRVFNDSPALYCGVAAVGCPEWWSDTAKSSHFECRYSTHVVDLAYCSSMRNPGTNSANSAKIVDPETGHVTVVTPSVDPDVFRPVDPVRLPDAQPDPNPTVNPTPEPTWDPETCVGDVCVPGPDPSHETGESGVCFPHGWGIFNPVEWVYRPVKCALVWAFVPRPAVVQQQVDTLHDDVMTKPPFAIVDAGVPVVIGLFQGYESGECGFDNFWPQGPALGHSEQLTIVCETPAGWAPVYGIAVVVIWAGALWQAVRMVAAGVGNREAG